MTSRYGLPPMLEPPYANPQMDALRQGQEAFFDEGACVFCTKPLSHHTIIVDDQENGAKAIMKLLRLPDRIGEPPLTCWQRDGEEQDE